MKKIAYKILRWMALVEGTSFILLLAAMPLKYKLGISEPVFYLGWTHGYLLIAFITVLAVALPILRWSLWRGLLLFFVALLPFGVIITDFKVKKWWQSQSESSLRESAATAVTQ